MKCIVWLKNAPREILPELRARGFHTGLWRDDEADFCLGLRDALTAPPAERTARLREWHGWLIKEEWLFPGGVAAAWYPDATPDQEAALREAFGDALDVREGRTIEEILGEGSRQLIRRVVAAKLPHPGGYNGAPLRLPDRRSSSGALLPKPGAFLCVYRWHKQPSPFIDNRLAACLLDDEYRVVPGERMDDLGLFENIDPRLIDVGGYPFLVTAYHMGGGLCRLEVRVMPSLRPVDLRGGSLAYRLVLDATTVRDFPDYPRGACQKNWVPFSDDERRLLLVYGIRPHRILEIVRDGERPLHASHAKLVNATDWTLPPQWRADLWGADLRHARPVRLPDGTFLSTFHTAVGDGDRRRYFTGFYRFEGGAPFRVLSMSSRPVLGPLNQYRHNKYNASKVVFIVSMQVEGDLIRLAGGDSDIRQIVAELSLPDVLAEMVDVDRSPLLDEVERLRAVAGLTDRQVLSDALHPDDEGADYLSGDRTYAYYRAIGAHLRPRRIGEIGVRFGYSLKAVAEGAQAAGVPRDAQSLRGWDGERDGIESNAHACRSLSLVCPDVKIVDADDTQGIEELGERDFDFFHVDADHSEGGAWHDIHLAWNATRAGGTVAVDDYGSAPVRRAVDRFAAKQGRRPVVLPTFRGLALLER